MPDKRERTLWLLGLGWPALMLGLACLWPGPGQPPPLEFDGSRRNSGPPVDSSGSRGDLSSLSPDARSSVFWSEPTPGKLKLRIEIPPE